MLAFTLLLAATVLLPAFWGSPWHPLRRKTIARILEFAEIRPGEKVYDLGSGDGRVLIAAARDHGAQGVGVDIDPLKVFFARWLARRAGVAGQVRFCRKNFFDMDVRDAQVVYVYLTHQALDKLMPRLLEQLAPTARIVSYRFCLKNRTPEKIAPGNDLFLYRLQKGNRISRYS